MTTSSVSGSVSRRDEDGIGERQEGWVLRDTQVVPRSRAQVGCPLTSYGAGTDEDVSAGAPAVAPAGSRAAAG